MHYTMFNIGLNNFKTKSNAIKLFRSTCKEK